MLDFCYIYIHLIFSIIQNIGGEKELEISTVISSRRKLDFIFEAINFPLKFQIVIFKKLTPKKLLINFNRKRNKNVTRLSPRSKMCEKTTAIH